MTLPAKSIRDAKLMPSKLCRCSVVRAVPRSVESPGVVIAGDFPNHNVLQSFHCVPHADANVFQLSKKLLRDSFTSECTFVSIHMSVDRFSATVSSKLNKTALAQ